MAALTVSCFRRFISFWFPVIGSMGVIFYTSSLPAKNIPALFPDQDILFHGLIYAILALLFYRALKNTFALLIFAQLAVFTIIFGFVYGVSDEFHQLFTPGRSCSGVDLAVDTLGSIAGSIMGGIFHKWLK